MDENSRGQSGYYIDEGLLLRATKDRDDEITREVLAELSFEPGLIALDEYRAVVYLADKWGRVVQRFDVREREASQLNYEGGFAVTRLPQAAPRGTLFDPTPRDFKPNDEGDWGNGHGGGPTIFPPFEYETAFDHSGPTLPPDPLGTPRPVRGFVDLHSHLTGEDAFGGSWYWGKIEGSATDAVPMCDGGNPFWQDDTHADLRFPFNLFGSLIGEDVEGHSDITYGAHPGAQWFTITVTILDLGFTSLEIEIGPNIVPGTAPTEDDFNDWPHANAIAHQQMWEGWIRRAYDGGMRVLVASLVESRLLCSATNPDTRKPSLASCLEMPSITNQAEAAWDFATQNADWMQIALSSSQARQIIKTVGYCAGGGADCVPRWGLHTEVG